MVLEAMGRLEECMSVGGESLKDITFAEDQAMIAIPAAGLQNVMDSLNEISKIYDMKIHVKKTKVKNISRNKGRVQNTFIDGQTVEQIKQFK